MTYAGIPQKQGLYDPSFEHDACGIGFVVNITGAQSHKVVEQGLTVLVNLDHRGARGCEEGTGDGAGMLLQLPHRFLNSACQSLNISLPAPGRYGVGMVYLPPDKAQRHGCEQRLEAIVREEGQTVLGWRDVPTNNAGLGETAKACEPCIRQVFIGRSADGLADDLAFERKLYVIRRRVTNAIRYGGVAGGEYFYIPSLSYKTLIYKGMLTPQQLETFYPDLSDPDMESAIAPTPFRVGNAPTRIATSSITARLIPYGGTSTGCEPGRHSWPQNSSGTTCRRSFRLFWKTAAIPPFLITAWNSWR